MALTITPFRSGKIYTIPQAARLASTSPQNVRNWLFGDQRPGHATRPVLGERARAVGPQLSFLDLAELLVVARFRQREGHAVPLNRLRKAHRFAGLVLKLPYPFASGQFKLEGGHLMHQFEGRHPGPGKLAVDMEGNYVLPLDFRDTLELFDFDPFDDMALRWYPYGKASPIVIDPEVASGWPSLQGFNVRVETIVRRFVDEWSIEEIAEDFGISRETIEDILRLTGAFDRAA